MDYSFVFLILLLPALSAIVLGLAGMKMSHKVAGLIGTLVLGTLFSLSLYTAIEYFLIQGKELMDCIQPSLHLILTGFISMNS